MKPNFNRTTQKRPVMVTLFVVIVALSALPQGLEFSAPILKSSLANAMQLIIIAMICPLVIGIYGVTAWGLWNLKNWSRYALIALIVVNFILQLAGKSMGDLLAQYPMAGAFAILLGFILRAYVVYWFLDNGQYFTDGDDYLQIYKEENIEFANRAEQEDNDEVEDAEDIVSDTTDKNSQMMRAIILASLAGIGVIVIGVAIALFMYLPRQTTTRTRIEPPAVSAVTPRPSKTPLSARSFASIKLTFNTQAEDSGIQYPEEIVADGQGNIYLDGLMDKTIYKFDPKGKNAVKLDITSDCPELTMLGAEVVDIDHYFYVMCGDTILQYTLNNFKLNTKFDGSTFSPKIIYKDLALYPDGTLLILADGDSAEIRDVVIHLDPKDGSVLQRFDNPVSNILKSSAMIAQLHPAVDSHGNIYILYGDDGTTYKFNAEGNYLLQFKNEHAETGIIGDIMHPQLSHPANLIAIDAADRIFTVDSTNLAQFDTNGNFLGQISIKFIGTVKDIYIYNEDELYLLGANTQTSTDEIYKVFKVKLYWQ